MKSLFRKWFVASVSSTVLVFSAAHGQGIPDDKSKAYHGSTDIPDAIAFQQFLLFAQESPTSLDSPEVGFVASALGRYADENGNYDDDVRAKSDALKALQKELEQTKLVKANNLVCTDNRASRLSADSHAAVNAVDDMEIAEAQKAYESFRNTLSSDERKALEKRMERLKKSTSYERIDSRASDRDIAVDIETYCMKLNYQLTAMGIEK